LVNWLLFIVYPVKPLTNNNDDPKTPSTSFQYNLSPLFLQSFATNAKLLVGKSPRLFND